MAKDAGSRDRPAVLIVNDVAEMLMALVAALADQDVDVVTAGSGHEALRVLLRRDVAVILLDVHMPGMSGFEVAEHVRASARHATTPIIFVTAERPGDAHRFAGYELGAVDFLVAPVQAHVLRSKVAVFAEMFRQRHELKRRAARIEELSHRLLAVEEEERRRLSSELHERTSPNLAAVRLDLATFAAGLPDEVRQRSGAMLEDIGALLEDTMASVRDICADLRMPTLDYAGLVPALEQYAAQFARRTGTAVTVDAEGCAVRLGAELESLLFRIAQEALTNCAKHARAAKLRIELRHEAGRISLSIVDDGCGFDPALLGQPGHPPGLGLLTMRERAEFAGGRFDIDSRPGQGTRIDVEI